MNKPKLLRAPAALLRYFRATSVVVSAIIFSLLAPTPLIDAIHRSVFKDEKERPPHPLRSVYLAYLLMRACNIRSENTLAEKISRNSASKRLGFRKQNIDLCTSCNCKHLKSCPYIQHKENKFPEDCLMYSYENAQPGHKGGADGDYRYVGYKKHDAIDLLSGLRIATIFTPGNASDNTIGLELLKLVKQRGFRPKYVLADSGYDDIKIYEFIIHELESKPFIKMNLRNTVARSFTYEACTGKMKTSPLGTPFCNANHLMKFVASDNEKATWTCPIEQMDQSHMEDGKCLFNPDHDCVICTYSKDDIRRFSLPPRESDEWNSIYKLRKEGEQTFSQYDENTLWR